MSVSLLGPHEISVLIELAHFRTPASLFNKCAAQTKLPADYVFRTHQPSMKATLDGIGDVGGERLRCPSFVHAISPPTCLTVPIYSSNVSRTPHRTEGPGFTRPPPPHRLRTAPDPTGTYHPAPTHHPSPTPTHPPPTTHQLPATHPSPPATHHQRRRL